jgi:hypothetical protein
MKQYLLSIYQPDGDSPPPEVLEPIMRDIDAVDRELRAAGAWVFTGGLHAPDTATALARRIFGPILAGFEQLKNDPTDDDATFAFDRSITFWTRLHGVLGLELAGHFVGMDVDPKKLYRDELQSMLAGGRSARQR